SALAAAAAPARAAAPYAVLSSNADHYRTALAGFEEAWGSSVPYALLGQEAVPPGAVVVAFGSRAARKAWPSDSLLVTCLAPGARPEREGGVLRADLLPEPALLVERLRRLLPRLKVLRVLWSSADEAEDVAAIAAEAREHGIEVRSERIAEPDDLPDALRGFENDADAFWLMPDPALVNARNFAILREFAAARREPFLAPTQGLAGKGATATLAASFRDVGRAAAEALKTRLAGADDLALIHPDTLRVVVNAESAARTGLDLKGARDVDEVLK
ncbi:MAG: hypothetical protein KGM24_11340, partial [Elusimicrobia bacterium]|nr:hypothetical protein [Elusimicrobiota bacterium]